MHRDAVESSSLRSVGYDLRRQVLEVEFATGRRYQYLDVPPEAHDELMAAPSLGRYFNAFIRDRYEAVEMEGAPRRR
ncbi:KTSC domain-containing protein [Schlegelella sp. S2-27]|uniref:KTSC domain-containing protein n=1 Tax=Caldimonas mangrovi TaxID=2944811 RepID=A0ABT0YJX0_9BURK|nr:KTSC domain-containing protein [Caldimonas mangrovi]MCM5678436.1 KTSC domain-containing protein [Caldimonas mangrovi]